MAAFFIAGILLGDAVWHGRLPIIAAPLALAFLGCVLFLVGRPSVSLGVAALLVLWLGIVTVNLYRVRVERTDTLTGLVADGEECRVEGIVLDEPEAKESAGLFGEGGGMLYRFHMRVTSIEAASGMHPASGKVVVTATRPSELGIAYGDRVAFRCEVQAPDPARNPGGFDYRAYLERKGIRWILRVRARHEVERLGGGGSPLWKLVYGVRERLDHSLDYGRMSDDARAFLRAVLLGERRALGEELEEALVHTNTVHILAISGLHVGIIALALRRVLKACFLPQWAASAATIAVLLLYAAMTGGRAPVVRATVMMTAILAAPLVRREPEHLNSLAFAAIVILLVRPLDVYAAGFQLSFVAAGAIVLLVPRLTDRAAERWHLRPEPGVETTGLQTGLNRLALRLVQLLAVTFSAFIAVAPLTAYHFNRFAPLSFIPNVAVVALMGLIVPIGLLGAFVGLVSPTLGGGLNTINGGLAYLLTRVVVLTSNVPWIHLNVRSAPPLVLVVYYAVLGAVGFAHSATRAMRIALAGALAVVGGVALWSPRTDAPGGTEIVVLDIGKGDSIFVRTREGRRILIDGGMKLGSDPGSWTIMPFLRSRGYNRLDAVVLTHYDADHYGGLAHVIGQMPVGRFIVRGGPASAKLDAVADLLELVERKGIPIEHVELGDRITAESDTPIVAISPDQAMPATTSENNASLVLRVGERPRMLLTADLERQSEWYLVDNRPGMLSAAVLKVPHQGSKQSSTDDFLGAVHPALAIITADRYKIHPHPAPEVVERYERRGIAVLRTDYHGAITVVLGNGGFRAWTMLTP